MNTLKRTIGFWTATSIVIGGMIGSGIFRKPALMMQQLDSAWLLLLVWVVAGVLTFLGALAVAEASALFPETGGQLVFFEKMYGRFFAFLFGWANFFVIKTGSIASVSYVFSEYAQTFVAFFRLSPEIEKSFALTLPAIGVLYPLQDLGLKLVTISVIWILTLINCVGVRWGALVQNIFTTMKLIAIFVLIVFCLTKGAFLSASLQAPFFPNASHSAIMSSFVAALSGAFWAYDGWMNVSFVAGEVTKPQRNLPLSLLVGTLIVAGVYVISNIAYLSALGPVSIKSAKLVASESMQQIIGPMGATFIAVSIMISTFGTSNGSILSGGRICFSMAQAGVFFSYFGNVNTRFFTPLRSLILQGVWASVLVLTGSFDQLTDMLIFVAWFFYMMSAVGVIVLRYRLPKEPRPFSVPAYPWTPLIFSVCALLFLIVTLVNDIHSYLNGQAAMIASLLGTAITLAGSPIYFLILRSRSSHLK